MNKQRKIRTQETRIQSKNTPLSFRLLEQRINEKYNDYSDQIGHYQDLYIITKLLNVNPQNLNKLKGFRILDLACGSCKTDPNKWSGFPRFEPMLCRALHETGAQVIGVDFQPTRREGYKTYKSDILEMDKLRLKPASFDIVILQNLFAFSKWPPHYNGFDYFGIELHGKRWYLNVSAASATASLGYFNTIEQTGNPIEGAFKTVLNHGMHLTKEGGYMNISTVVFQKKNGEFVVSENRDYEQEYNATINLLRN